jgi:hypothetical protein
VCLEDVVTKINKKGQVQGFPSNATRFNSCLLFYFHLKMVVRLKHVAVNLNEKSSEAESFRHMKIKISYTLEDGHVVKDSDK